MAESAATRTGWAAAMCLALLSLAILTLLVAIYAAQIEVTGGGPGGTAGAGFDPACIAACCGGDCACNVKSMDDADESALFAEDRRRTRERRRRELERRQQLLNNVQGGDDEKWKRDMERRLDMLENTVHEVSATTFNILNHMGNKMIAQERQIDEMLKWQQQHGRRDAVRQ